MRGGVAVELILERLGDGAVVGVDRSGTQVERARRRVRDARARFVVAEVAELAGELGGEGEAGGGGWFDKALAVNVNLFWTRSPAREMAVLREVLRPGGRLVVVYETPGGPSAAVERAMGAVAEEGWAVTPLRSGDLAGFRATAPLG
ncbi:methyltransferase domain-containing protein [Nonomuraea sp. NPDC050328]|uniref:methyltransferase domain-containing protein n=1 Tax=Nonomuraea sp. NPDC050328 TaxID=3364361 RepID=UPI0037B3C946